MGARSRIVTVAIGAIALLPSQSYAQQEFFDDFRYTSFSDPALGQFGWIVRGEAGGPGCEGAAWEPSLVEFWENADVPGDKVMGLLAITDGQASGTIQSQIHTANSRFKNGTYAARIQFSRAPGLFEPKEPSVQAFFTYSGQTAPCAESFCECDFEYLPTPGTFGLSQSGIWATTHETGGGTCPDGKSERWGDTTEVWRVCMIRVHDGSVEYLVDGVPFAVHADRFPPESVMQIMFNHWFDCSLLLPRSPLGYSFAVDWVYYSDSESMNQSSVLSRVAALRAGGTSRLDSVELKAKLTASDGAADDAFGLSVAVDGNTAVIGAWFDDDQGTASGSAYVFEKDGGAWTQVKKLVPLDGAAGDHFGVSVAVDGNTAVIGAAWDDDRGSSSGTAYVFEKVGGVWTQVKKLVPLDGAAGDLFGHSVAIDGSTAVIGADSDDDRGTNSGSAYVFEEVGGVWTQVKKLVPLDGAEFDYFGVSVAVDGNTVVIGAEWDDDRGSRSGSAYVFEKVDGAWTQVKKLVPLDGAADNYFGQSVAVDGNTVVIGAYFDDDRGSLSGSAYLFEKVGGVWTQIKKLVPLDGAAYDYFGNSVAVDGNTAVIGAYSDDDRGSNSGSAYVFEKVGGAWTQVKKLVPLDSAAGDLFGNSVAVDGGTAMIGAEWDDDRGSNSGSAFVFDLGATCPADFNGDGFVNGNDYDAFAELFDIADSGADLNADGFVNGDDFDLFAEHFDVGC